MVGNSPKWRAGFGRHSVGETPTDATGTVALPEQDANDSGVQLFLFR
jgi:hypothetical protein